MPFPAWLGRFNSRYTNRLMQPVALRVPYFALVEHVGRRSGRRRRTPVNVFPRGDRYVVALTYGPDAQWVHNVLAAGGCTLVSRSGSVRLTAPRRIHDASRRVVPWWIRPPLRLLGVTDFLELRRAAAGGSPMRRRSQFAAEAANGSASRGSGGGRRFARA